MKFTTDLGEGFYFPDAGLMLQAGHCTLTHTVIPGFYILVGKLINSNNKKSTDLKSVLHLEDFQKMYT
jgi:hypothetical protein